MEIGTISLLIVAVMLGLLIVGVPFAFAAGAVATVTALVQFGPGGLSLLAARTYELLNGYTLVAVPMFVLMAALLEGSNIARDLFSAFRVWAGRLPGGVGVMTMVVSVILASTTGIIGGEIVLLGLIALPQMLRLGYDKKIAIGTICAGGSLGTMIPPSIILIFFGLTANISIAHLFLASVIPGLLLAGVYMAYIVLRCWLNPGLASVAPPEERDMTVLQKLALLKGVALPVGVAAVMLGSIYMGIASITESAALGVVGILIATAVRGELSWKLVLSALRQTMLSCGVVIWLVFGTNGLVGVYNAIGGIQFLQSEFVGFNLGMAGTLTVMVGVFIVLGAFIDWIGIMFLTIPIFLPIIKSMGLDPIWFGIVFNVSMQIAYLSPPFAPAAFYLKGVAPPEITIEEIFGAMWPFIGLQILVLGFIVAFPAISLWLPRLMYH